ncbi:MAG: hypothetical protein BJ554DRAFT_6870 [Olpidium bornovanus]|uniref:RING-type domain-containing protein n=1 Tax=Olpidium bornovanus TaxID=278681 RepID=A0A8H7ZWT6_9FUNG|nr:MAG: hypothetical protein BJ554DRAFT_6870 [Olpidium bornovanus]
MDHRFRFVVNPTSNYTPQLVDPDAQVDWEVVEQAVISYTRDPSCPICLGYPTAPRVTKCGHAFCLVCILHYLSLSEDQHRQWRKCPICWDCVYAKDLKPVRFWKVQSVGKVIEGPGGTVIAPQDDETVAMQLMYREMVGSQVTFM